MNNTKTIMEVIEIQWFFQEILKSSNNNINEFMKLFENMEFVSADENYDKFCENIKNKRKYIDTKKNKPRMVHNCQFVQGFQV